MRARPGPQSSGATPPCPSGTAWDSVRHRAQCPLDRPPQSRAARGRSGHAPGGDGPARGNPMDGHWRLLSDQ
eukprot:11188368-Lingulodinium_polyedra.AAC.1